MAEGGSKVSTFPECAIIHEIYDGENAEEQFEYELERALESGVPYIVVEPSRLGDETARWIMIGNCLHKTAVLAGLSCALSTAIPSDYMFGHMGLPSVPRLLGTTYDVFSLCSGVVSFACAALYEVSWQSDPCCKYQVEYDARNLAGLPLHSLTSASPVVLVRKDNTARRRLHSVCTTVAALCCGLRIYRWYFQ
ncbi:transmembrane protein 11, mitochondrial-like [Branchiostoma floridae x Branchiostoma japonicum]